MYCLQGSLYTTLVQYEKDCLRMPFSLAVMRWTEPRRCLFRGKKKAIGSLHRVARNETRFFPYGRRNLRAIGSEVSQFRRT